MPIFTLHMQVGWLGAAICAVLSARCAREFFIGVPRFFSCLALLALAWVMLLPFYGGIINSPLLPGFGSFLLVHSGGLVRSEAHVRSSGKDAGGVDILSQIALLLLIPLAIPSVPFQTLADLGLRAADLQLIAGTVLGAMGYAALWLGVKALYDGRGAIYYSMSAITLVYASLEAAFLMSQFSVINAHGLVMPPGMSYGFVVAKIALTVMFSYALIRYHEPTLGVRFIALRFWGVRPVHEHVAV